MPKNIDALHPYIRQLYELYGDPQSPSITISKKSDVHRDLANILEIGKQDGFVVTVRQCNKRRNHIRVIFRPMPGKSSILKRMAEIQKVQDPDEHDEHDEHV